MLIIKEFDYKLHFNSINTFKSQFHARLDVYCEYLVIAPTSILDEPSTIAFQSIFARFCANNWLTCSENHHMSFYDDQKNRKGSSWGSSLVDANQSQTFAFDFVYSTFSSHHVVSPMLTHIPWAGWKKRVNVHQSMSLPMTMKSTVGGYIERNCRVDRTSCKNKERKRKRPTADF